jgi:type IV pilus assembly protein PilA
MLLQNLRAKIGARLNGDSEAGFTLIELLVVMLILGILAAIALPAFFNQKSKAGDAKAKETAHSAQVAMETCGTDNNGEYSLTKCNLAALQAIEPTIPSTGVAVTGNTPAGGYTIVVTGTSGTFTIERLGSGAMAYPCSAGGKGGCPDDATPGGVGVWG